MLADQLIQQAWKTALPQITLWNTFTPVDENAAPQYPMAEVIPSGYADEPTLSGSKIETHRFKLSIADRSRANVFELARTARAAIEGIEDPSLVESSAELADFATPWDGGGRQIIWEIEVTVTLQIFEKG